MQKCTKPYKWFVACRKFFHLKCDRALSNYLQIHFHKIKIHYILESSLNPSPFIIHVFTNIPISIMNQSTDINTDYIITI